MKKLLFVLLLILGLSSLDIKAQNVRFIIDKDYDESGTIDISTIREACMNAAEINGINVVNRSGGNADLLYSVNIVIKYLEDVQCYVCAFTRVIVFVNTSAFISQAPNLIISSSKNDLQNNIIKTLRNRIAELPDIYKE